MDSELKKRITERMEKAVGSLFHNNGSIRNRFQNTDDPGDTVFEKATNPLERRLAKPDEFSTRNTCKPVGV